MERALGGPSYRPKTLGAFVMITGVVRASREAVIRIDSVGTDSLVGMSLLYGFKLTIETVDGGQVLIGRL